MQASYRVSRFRGMYSFSRLRTLLNPCPCGYYGDPLHHCVCTPGQIQRYMNKISGPLLDRIDIHCEIQAVPFAQLSQMKPGEPSAVVRERVIKARQIQTERFRSSPQSGGQRGAILWAIAHGRSSTACSTKRCRLPKAEG